MILLLYVYVQLFNTSVGHSWVTFTTNIKVNKVTVPVMNIGLLIRIEHFLCAFKEVNLKKILLCYVQENR